MNPQNGLNAQAKPPSPVRDTYKNFHRLDHEALEIHPHLLDPRREDDINDHILRPINIEKLLTELRQIFMDFLSTREEYYSLNAHMSCTSHVRTFEVTRIPGLYIYPSLLPPVVQKSLLDKLLHRDLNNHGHMTNVHLHHDVLYPSAGDGESVSYFSPSASDVVFTPKDKTVHKPVTSLEHLTKKLRWMTLGGQYDWTNKVYPSQQPPAFPADLKQLIERIFPMQAEAAIVNLYSPGNTLSLHRDVSEDCNEPLVSISLGCDGIFVVGLECSDGDGDPRVVTIRLRSGDAVLMSGESRYAWHGVPKVLEGTCPEFLQDWPFQVVRDGDESVEQFDQWKGWMSRKRINLNVRQMFP